MNKMMKRWGAVCLLMVMAGCGRNESGSNPKTEVDINGAKQVAAKFLSSIAAGNFQQASMYVMKEQRAAFVQEAKKEMQDLPPLPAQLEFDLQVGNDQAVLAVKNWGGGIVALTLRVEDGTWKIEK